MNHWESVLRDQVAKLIFSGLYDHATAVHCFCVGPEAKRASLLLQEYGSKFTVEAVAPEDKSGERLTLFSMHKLVHPDDKILYLHTKGITKLPPSENVYWWNFYMEYHLIKHYEQCLKLLDQADVVGLDFYPQSLPHFSGNFWWARADHIVKLGTCGGENGDKYAHTETWICGGHDKVEARLATLAHSGNDHYTYPYLSKKYIA